jgi:hypothetical protein
VRASSRRPDDHARASRPSPAAIVPALTALLLVESGCGSVPSRAETERPTRASAAARSNSPRRARAGAPAPQAPAPAEPAAPAAKADGVRYQQVDLPSDDAGPAAPDRLVFYEGACRLRAPDPQDVLQDAIAKAEAVGGYIESRTDTAAVLRVPVAEFRPTFDAILELGVVLSRRLTAADVTDQVTDLELRLKTLTAARARLQQLLAEATNESRQLALLREIDRLTIQIDQLSLRLRTLKRLAAFSRISVDVTGAAPAVVPGAENDVAGLAWIRGLSPFGAAGFSNGSELEIEAPPAMVELDVEDHFRAEAADGAFVRAVRRPNEPVGSTRFWVEALEHRLGPAFAEHEAVSVGGFRGVRLVHQGDASYRYLVLARVQDDDLELVEVYYPDAASETRHEAAVEAALGGGAPAS